MNENANKLHKILLNELRDYPMDFQAGVAGFSMKSISHAFGGFPSCIKGFTVALIQDKKGLESITYPFKSVMAADDACARYIGLETRAAIRLFYPHSMPFEKNSVLDVIWSHSNTDPMEFCGISGARAASMALVKAIENFPRISI